MDTLPTREAPASSLTKGADTWHAPGRFVFVLGLFIVAMFPDVVSGTNTFFYRDFGVWAYPDALYHRECFWRGEIPLWNPCNNCGLPFLAQWNTITLYPLSLIYLLLPLPWSLNLFCLFHLCLAGTGMYLLACRWTNDRFAASVAGMAFALNGLALHSLMWPNNIAALGWLPFVLLFVERAWNEGDQWLVFAVVAGANQMLAGAPEIILLTWFAAFVLAAAGAIGQKRLAPKLAWRFGSVAALTALLCAAQLLPFLELIKLSHRSAAFGDSTWSMPAWGWANFLVPLFHQSKSVVGVYSQDDQQWTSSYYVGIGVVSLALVAILRIPNSRVRVLGGLGLLGLLMSMGDHTVLYRSIKTLFPQMGFFRFPIKFVVLAIFAFPLLAGCAVRQFRPGGDRGQTFKRTIGIIWLTVLIVIFGIVWFAHRQPVVNENWIVTLQSGAGRAVFLTLIVAALSSLTWIGTRRRRCRVQWAVVLLIGLDAATHAPRQNPTIAAAVLRPNAAGLSAMPKLGEGRALVTREVQNFMDHAATANLEQYHLGQRKTLFANCNLIDRIPKTSGFYSLYLRDETPVRALFDGPTNRFPSGLADFLGVTRISSSENIFGWITRSTALPTITAGQQPIMADAAATLTALMDPRFDSRVVVYLPVETGRSLHTTNRSEARVQDSHIAAHRMEAMVNSKTPTLVVAAQSFAPGWQARVDGQAVPLLRANHAFQAVEVPEGRHAVTIFYRDWFFCIGLVVSTLTLIPCAIRVGVSRVSDARG